MHVVRGWTLFGALIALALLPYSAPAEASQEVLPLPQKIANFQGQVNAIVAQPDGKVVIGGGFKAINGVAHRNLARLNPDGSVDDSWNPDCNGIVWALTEVDGKLFVGGQFSQIGNATRVNLAALDAATGAALTFAPDPVGYVRALAHSSDTLYVAGDFSVIGNVARKGLAAVAVATGAATSWDPNYQDQQTQRGPIGYVDALEMSDNNTVYVGGLFSAIGGQPRVNLAEVDAATGRPTDWNPAPNESVFSLALSAESLYVGGAFVQIGGEARNYIAEISRSTSAATGWNPGANSYVFSILPSGDVVYAGGAFSAIGGEARSMLAALDRQTGLASSWQRDIGIGNFEVNALALIGPTLSVGGTFPASSGHNSGGIARFDTLDAAIASTLNVATDAIVLAIKAQPDGKVVIAGDFTEVDGIDRNRIARLNADNTVDLDWNPGADQSVFSLEIIDGIVYAGGPFQYIGGKQRFGLASLNGANGMATAWNPSPNGYVQTMTKLHDSLYVAGTFTKIGAASRQYLAAFDMNGALTNWDPHPNDIPFALAATDAAIYAGGNFTHIGGADRARLAALDTISGVATSWNPGVSVNQPGDLSSVAALATEGNAVYAGGYFSTIGGAQRNNVAAIDASTGAATDWNPGPVNFVYAIAVHDGFFYVGGSFIEVAGEPHGLLGAIDRYSAAAVGWNAAPWSGSYVVALDVANDHVYAGGFFAVADGAERESLVVLDKADKIFHEPFEQAQ
jgi:Domain of unknown function (DUF5122) beta-propeller